MSSNIKKYIEQLKKEVADRCLELEAVTDLYIEFEDLDYEMDRWKVRRLKSHVVNLIAENYDQNHSCGCCADAALYIRPYITRSTKDTTIKIYSDPVTFNVATRGGTGYYSMPGWSDAMIKAGISNEMIQKICRFLEDNKPKYDNIDDDWI